MVQQQQQQQQLNTNSKLATLARHQMFDHNLHLHHVGHHVHHHDQSSPQTQQKFATNHRFNPNTANNNNNTCQYVDLNNTNSASTTTTTTGSSTTQPPALPPPMLHSTQATTAYLVQTPNGSALLIPPQTALNPSNHFIQTATNQPTQHTTNTFSLNRNPYGITTIPLQNTILGSNPNNPQPQNTLLPHSPSVTSAMNCAFSNRPDSTASTNVYQTIDTEK